MVRPRMLRSDRIALELIVRYRAQKGEHQQTARIDGRLTASCYEIGGSTP